MSVLERQRAILEDGCHYTIVWQSLYCRKLTFGLVGSAHFYAVEMCVTWLHSRGNDREYRLVDITPCPGGEREKGKSKPSFVGGELRFLKPASVLVGLTGGVSDFS